MANIEYDPTLDLLKSSYNFELPSRLIAERPIPGRDQSKLLVYNQKTDEIIHTQFDQIGEYLPNDSHLVLNQSKVFPCRLIGEKSTGGKAEVFLLSLIHQNNIYPAMIKTRGKKELGQTLYFDQLEVKIIHRNDDGTFGVEFNKTHDELMDFLESHAKVPIPPYIRGGESDEKDKEDYQTVYAKETGSVAAPTAGLHFTEKVFNSLKVKGIDKSFVTLHVGAGTFLPVKTDSIKDHQMHSEYYQVKAKTLDDLNKHHGHIFAVGTTSLRVLESTFKDNRFQTSGELESTQIFLHPGVEVKSIAGLITNFHLPESTLLMLVSSLIGRKKALALYKEAIDREYRFFSYGDSMLIIRDI